MLKSRLVLADEPLKLNLIFLFFLFFNDLVDNLDHTELLVSFGLDLGYIPNTWLV